MRDGVTLRADLQLPEAGGPFPVLVYRTPYDKHAARDFSLFARAVARGWAVVVQDVRGRYASDGEFDPYRHEGRDGYDTIEWAARQPWSDGRVGTAGLSYPGAVQWLAALESPPHLRAMVPAMTFSSPRRFFYFGGAFDLSWIGWVWLNVAPDLRARLDLPGPRDRESALELWQAEGERMRETRPLAALPDLAGVAPFYYEWLRHPPEDPWWDFAELRGRYQRVGAAVLHVSGWHDEAYGPEGALTNFQGIVASRRDEADPRTRLVIGPWVHGVSSVGRRRFGDRDFGAAASLDYDALVLDFLDLHVRGLGVPADERVRVFVMGADEWRGFEAWPPPAAPLALHLAPGTGGGCGALREQPGEAAERAFRSDPARPVSAPTDDFGAFDHRALAERPDALCFESEPLPEDLDVIGPVEARVAFTADVPDLDLHLKLFDVAPDGTAWNLWSPGLDVERASLRTGRRRLLVPDERATLEFPRLATANRFRAGHRIRVVLLASYAPWLSVNLQTGLSEADSSATRAGTVRVFLGGGQGSRIGLPVVAPGATRPAPSRPPVVEATIAGLQAAIRSGRSNCREIVQAHLDRIEAYDESTGLDAISMLNPRALERADAIDAALARGEEPGPLFCAPILVKDNFDTHDLPTTAGSIALAGSVPPDDAFMVRRLREAGAIVLAKTNMAEWAFSPRQTVSSTRGTTANAYALDRVPAGSSGGTASGVAASFGVAGLGSDTGNSIRGPSSRLGLFGIRATLGLTSLDGVVPLVADWDVAGPMTRSVEDGARLFDVVSGYDPADPMAELGREHHEPDYTAFLQRDALRGARLGVLRELVDAEDADAQVIAVFERALDELRAAGAEIVDPLVIDRFAEHREADDFCPSFRYDVSLYFRSLGDAAPLHDVREVLETGQYAPYVRDRLDFYLARPRRPPGEWDPPCPRFPDHPARQAYRADVVAAMDASGVDAILYPSWTGPPAALERAREDYRGDNSQVVAPSTGLPAVTVPMGETHGGLPAGLQMLGRPFSEGRLIALAYAYEQATRHRRPPERFPELPPAR
jgi:putative CocE/NonD family hydrolase